MEISSLKELFEHELRDLYSAEQQILKALPKMVKAARSRQLREAMSAHLAVTEKQAARLDRIFERRGIKLARAKKCKGMEGLLEEGEELMQEEISDDVVDAALIASAQRVEHYEIAAYGTARSFAEWLEDDESVKLLQQSLDEESDADRKLSELAESSVNRNAAEEEEEERTPVSRKRR
jgi:ferritin-like metal-binding protein YciE